MHASNARWARFANAEVGRASISWSAAPQLGVPWLASASTGQRDQLEALVVIVGVVELATAAGHDPPGGPVARPGGRHRVLVVIAARMGGQQVLVVVEHDAVLRVRERSAGLDQRD